MEEEVTRRTVAISVQATKLTGRVLCKALQKFLAEVRKQRRASLAPHGRQSVKQLMGHGGQSSSIQLKGDARLFDRVARKFNVDYAFHKVGSKDYLLFFKAGQADAITAAFSDYTKRVMARQKDKPSILRGLRQAVGHTKTRQKEREKIREAVQER
ncbi:MAG: PcfB family protein [Enterocloster asparagiformis]|nr:PcfB family protein [Enterocloster asparagiformis]